MSEAVTIVLRNANNAKQAWAYLKDWPLAVNIGKPLAVQISTAKSKRTLAQNARFHAICKDFSEQVKVEGMTPGWHTWKLYFKSRYLEHEEIKLPDGQIINQPISTSDLSIEGFIKFFADIDLEAADYGVTYSNEHEELKA